MRTSGIALLAFLVNLAVALPVRAANDVEVEVAGKALFGKTKPGIVLLANKGIRSAHASLTRGDGKKVEVSAKGIPAGGKATLSLDAPPGESHYSGTLSVSFVDGSSGQMPVEFDVEVSKGLTMEVPEDRLDTKAGKLGLKMSGTADKCEYDVTFDGADDRHGVQRFEGERAGTWLTLTWPTHGEADVVLRIHMTCYDADGFFTGVDLYPWKLAIPHQEVVFDTAKWDVLPSESAKLKDALGQIDTALKRYGKVVPIKLYVMGHTDTVGDAASNRVLSKNRARAIGAWFAQQGMAVPIFYAGFGEDFPAVDTPDNTDEPRNRRADYVLSNQAPSQAGWEKLPGR